MAGSTKSDVVLADYKTDQDAELERPEQFSLINTSNKTRTKVQLPDGISYTFRSLARGPEGEALLLTTDGKLRYFDEKQAKNWAILASWMLGKNQKHGRIHAQHCG